MFCAFCIYIVFVFNIVMVVLSLPEVLQNRIANEKNSTIFFLLLVLLFLFSQCLCQVKIVNEADIVFLSVILSVCARRHDMLIIMTS